MIVFDLKVTYPSDPWLLNKATATILISYIFLTITQVFALAVSLSILFHTIMLTFLNTLLQSLSDILSRSVFFFNFSLVYKEMEM